MRSSELRLLTGRLMTETQFKRMKALAEDREKQTFLERFEQFHKDKIKAAKMERRITKMKKRTIVRSPEKYTWWYYLYDKYESIDKLIHLRNIIFSIARDRRCVSLNRALEVLCLEPSREGQTLGWDYWEDLQDDLLDDETRLFTWEFYKDGTMKITFRNLHDISGCFKTEDEIKEASRQKQSL